MVYVLGVYWCICLVSGVGSKTLCHACMWRIGVQVLSALNPVDPLHNCMFENKLCLQNVFAKNYFAMFRKAPEVGNIICIFLQTKSQGKWNIIL